MNKMKKNEKKKHEKNEKNSVFSDVNIFAYNKIAVSEENNITP